MLSRKILAEINERSQKKGGDLWPFVAVGAGVVVLAALLLLTYTFALAGRGRGVRPAGVREGQVRAGGPAGLRRKAH